MIVFLHVYLTAGLFWNEFVISVTISVEVQSLLTVSWRRGWNDFSYIGEFRFKYICWQGSVLDAWGNRDGGGVGCQLLIVTVLQNGVVLISCIDFYVIHLLAGSLKQESILWRILLLLKANLVLMMHEEILRHWHFSVRFLLKNQLR